MVLLLGAVLDYRAPLVLDGRLALEAVQRALLVVGRAL